MPQLDRIIIFPQIFWFFIIFVIFYIILIHIYLPKFIYSLKGRKQIILNNTLVISQISDQIKQENLWITKNLNLNFKKIQTCFFLNPESIHALFLNSKFTNPIQFESQVIKIVHNNILFCNKYTLNRIQIYNSNLNLKN